MLVLSRKIDQDILIDGDIRIKVIGIRGNQVRIGIEAPDSLRVFREELLIPAAVGELDEVDAIGAGRGL